MHMRHTAGSRTPKLRHIAIAPAAGSPRRRVTTGSGAGCPDCLTSSLYLFELTYELYVFSLLNFFLVSGSIHILDTAAPEVAASFSLRASNHSRVTGGRLAIFRFRLYLRLQKCPLVLGTVWLVFNGTFHHTTRWRNQESDSHDTCKLCQFYLWNSLL